MSFGCERSCSSPRKVSNFNSKVPQGGIYPYIKFERDRLNIFRVRVLTSSGFTGGGRGGGDAKTIISPNTSFGDITMLYYARFQGLSGLIVTRPLCELFNLCLDTPSNRMWSVAVVMLNTGHHSNT